jgi:ubiquinol-cytochrome c reductase iron-sulfur subunit
MPDTPEHDGSASGAGSPGHDGSGGPAAGIHPDDLPNGPDATPPKMVEVSINAPQFQVSAAHPERVERGIAVMFMLGLVGAAGFGAAYWQNWSNFWLGVTLAVAMFGLGIGMVAWGKYLMPRGPFSESRHAAGPTEEERQEFLTDFSSRGKIAIERRSFLLKILAAAGGVFGIVALFPLLRSLGPLPKHLFYETKWRRGSYLTTPDGRRVHKDDLVQGGVLTVFPEDDLGGALSQTLLIRPLTTNIQTAPDRASWGPEGYLAFSKVCTHAGCPVALFQKAIDQLLCPCHQSIFEVGPNKPAMPIFGPAPRPLPQLPLYIDRNGYLRAQGGYDQPVGPGFWERGDKGIPQ